MSDQRFTDPEAWHEWLHDYGRDVLAEIGDDERVLGDLTSEQRESGWLGFAPADEAMLGSLEATIGQSLPPSYRAFLSTPNGWTLHSGFVGGLLPADRVEAGPGGVMEDFDAYADAALEDDDDGAGAEHVAHLRRCLFITAPNEDYWLLDPQTTRADGEWEAAEWQVKYGEYIAYDSFRDLLFADRESAQESTSS